MLYNLESTLKLQEWNSVKQLVKDLNAYQEESKIVECGIDLLLSDGNCPRETIIEDAPDCHQGRNLFTEVQFGDDHKMG